MTQAQWTIIGIAALIGLIVFYGQNKHLNSTVSAFFKDAWFSAPSSESSKQKVSTVSG